MRIPSLEYTAMHAQETLRSHVRAREWRCATSSASKTRERAKSGTDTAANGLGHWRNRWEVPEKHSDLARAQGALPLGDGTWLGFRRFATSEDAQRHALRHVDHNFSNFGIRYLGPEFFPDY